MVFHPVLDKIQNSIDKELPLLSLHQLCEEISLCQHAAVMNENTKFAHSSSKNPCCFMVRLLVFL